ncbi:MAG: hypothetical protein ABIH72_01400 [archaeon]
MPTEVGVKYNEQEVDAIVNASSDPELTKLVLAKLSNAGKDIPPLHVLAENLGIEINELRDIGFYLDRNNIIKPSMLLSVNNLNKEAQLVIACPVSINYYFQSDLPFGPAISFYKSQLSQKDLVKLMTSVSDSVKFRYKKGFTLSRDSLDKIREAMHSEVESLLEKQADMYGAEKDFGSFANFPSFVKKANPHSTLGFQDKVYFELEAEFTTAQAAANEGFHDAIGSVQLSREHHVFDRGISEIGYAVRVDNNSKNRKFSFLNLRRCPEASYGSHSLMKETAMINEDLVSRLENSLS